MSEIEESDSHDENSESDHDDGLRRETLLISCKCEKCLDLESFCCLQFSKIKKECQEKGEKRSRNSLDIFYVPDTVRTPSRHNPDTIQT